MQCGDGTILLIQQESGMAQRIVVKLFLVPRVDGQENHTGLESEERSLVGGPFQPLQSQVPVSAGDKQQEPQPFDDGRELVRVIFVGAESETGVGSGTAGVEGPQEHLP
jgi:hypothetical protein